MKTKIGVDDCILLTHSILLLQLYNSSTYFFARAYLKFLEAIQKLL